LLTSRLLLAGWEYLRCSASSLDFFLRRRRKQVCLHLDFTCQLAGSKDLYAVSHRSNNPELHQAIRVEGIPFQLVEPAHVYDCVFFSKYVGKATLRQPAVQRHLPALKPAHLPKAANGPLSLLAPPGGLPAAGAHPTPNATFDVLLTRRRFQFT
jgi:hypothetical protein